jgi:hypothetical protein
MIVDGVRYLNSSNINVPDELPLKEWTKQFYYSCKNPVFDIENYRMDKELYFIPVAIYELDPLEMVLESIDEFPQFGKDLPNGHQTVIVCYKKKYYYYDPEEGVSEEIDTLRTVFPTIKLVKGHHKHDNHFCLLYCIQFMIDVWSNPKRLIKERKISNRQLERLSKIII